MKSSSAASINHTSPVHPTISVKQYIIMDFFTENSTAFDTDITEDSYNISSTLPVNTDNTTPYVLLVYGLPGPIFSVIHILALISLIASLLMTFLVLFFTFKDLKPKSAIWRRPIGERLVFYLALCDILYCCSHILDHSYMLITVHFPPDELCRLFAFFLAEFILAQSIIVTFTALNAFIMVVKERKIHLGSYDWRLLTIAIGAPALVLIVWEILEFLGPSGPWCFIDMRRPTVGMILTNIVSILLIVTFTADLLFYGLVWGKITATARSASSTTGGKKYHRSARVMMLFVMAYLLQWWPYCLYSWMVLFGVDSVVIIIFVVIFCNFGGGFNFVVYVLVRRKYAVTEGTTTSGDKNHQAGGRTTTSSSDAGGNR